MIVESKTIKGGYSSFMIKYRITSEFMENHRMLFDPYKCKALSHVMFPSTFYLCEVYGFCNGFGVSPKYIQENEIGCFRS